MSHGPYRPSLYCVSVSSSNVNFSFAFHDQHCKATILPSYLSHASKLIPSVGCTIKLRSAKPGLVASCACCSWLLENPVVTPRIIFYLIWPTSLKPICLPHPLTTPCLWKYVYAALQRSNYSLYSHTSLRGEAVALMAFVTSLECLFCDKICVVPF